MRTRLPVALFNYENGGQIEPGCYRFDKLAQAFNDITESPVIIGINETNDWHLWGEKFLLAAANTLSAKLGRRYVARIGHGDRAGAAPALLFDAQEVELLQWGTGHESVHSNSRNLARFVSLADGATFQVLLDHWVSYSGDVRLARAREIGFYGVDSTPTLFMGDLNCTASGLHLPQRDWLAARNAFKTGKAIELSDGTLIADTRAMDHLLGYWHEQTQQRRPGRGFHALAEIAHFKQGMVSEQAFAATVNDNIDTGGGLLIDWMLVNNAWREALVPNTYRVHIPPGTQRSDYPSDHRLVTATLFTPSI